MTTAAAMLVPACESLRLTFQLSLQHPQHVSRGPALKVQPAGAAAALDLGLLSQADPQASAAQELQQRPTARSTHLLQRQSGVPHIGCLKAWQHLGQAHGVPLHRLPKLLCEASTWRTSSRAPQPHRPAPTPSSLQCPQA